jgi:hypothetical protein
LISNVSELEPAAELQAAGHDAFVNCKQQLAALRENASLIASAVSNDLPSETVDELIELHGHRLDSVLELRMIVSDSMMQRELDELLQAALHEVERICKLLDEQVRRSGNELSRCRELERSLAGYAAGSPVSDELDGLLA